MGYEASLLSFVQLGEGVKLGRAPILLWQVTHYPQGSFIITDSLIKRMQTGKKRGCLPRMRTETNRHYYVLCAK